MINVFGSDLGEEEIKAVNNCINSQWVGFGKDVERFEQEFMRRQEVNNFLMVDSGSNALYMACHLLGLKPNDEIIIPSFTWVSCAQAALLCGLKPIFADVDIDTMNITAEHIKNVITPKTKAIMVVHYAGLPVEMDEIRNLDLPIIEDAAHAVDAKYKGIQCGAISDIGIFSFDAVKNLTAIEGGGICFQSDRLKDQAKKLRYCGIGKSGFDSMKQSSKTWWEYNITEPFIKMLPTNLHAVVACEQLSKLPRMQARRKEIWDHYQATFSSLEQCITPAEAPSGSRHGYFTYCLRAAQRDELANYLLKNEIYTTLRYHPLHLNKLYNQQNITLSNSQELNETGLSLPIHPRLSDHQVDYICEKVKSFYSKKCV